MECSGTILARMLCLKLQSLLNVTSRSFNTSRATHLEPLPLTEMIHPQLTGHFLYATCNRNTWHCICVQPERAFMSSGEAYDLYPTGPFIQSY